MHGTVIAGPEAHGITDDDKAREIEKIVAAADRFILEKDAARVGGREVI